MAIQARSEWPTFIVASQTVYCVAAPSAERALQWFADATDIDLDVITVDFGRVEVIDQMPATPSGLED